jgi:hypothetical protein
LNDAEREIMDNIIESMGHALDCVKTKLTWYSVTHDDQYLNESKEWVSIVNMYMDKIISGQHSEQTK